jgi:hypothetical protein
MLLAAKKPAGADEKYFILKEQVAFEKYLQRPLVLLY